ncbi:MAG: peroxide stress protein YaaA [Bacteroidota bacterium]
MIAVVSPAKTLDFESKYDFGHTLPKFQKEALTLIQVLKEQSEDEVSELMSISDQLAHINVERYHKFTQKKNPAHARHAIFAFQGDVYQGLGAEGFSEKELDFSQSHFRILSGLYGLIRPLDLIQPYRLEMGTKLRVNGSKNLYEFWGDKIASQLNTDLKQQGDNLLINLASVEYFKSVDLKKLKAKVIDVDFKNFSNGEYKVISFFAKKARGMMSRYIIKNQPTTVEGLKGFDYGGYYFDESNSTDGLLAFKRG